MDSLTPGTRYTFTVWAVGFQGHTSNNITCVDTSGTLSWDEYCSFIAFFCMLLPAVTITPLSDILNQRRILHRKVCFSSGNRTLMTLASYRFLSTECLNVLFYLAVSFVFYAFCTCIHLSMFSFILLYALAALYVIKEDDD